MGYKFFKNTFNVWTDHGPYGSENDPSNEVKYDPMFVFDIYYIEGTDVFGF